MSTTNTGSAETSANTPFAMRLPEPVLVVFRGVGQIVFQENALTGLFFVLGVAVSSPTMSLGLLAGGIIGYAVAITLRFDRSETTSGIYGFNSALVGIATLFFFQPSAVSIALLVVGCITAALLTMLARTRLSFPTYTSPFIVVTWILFLIGPGLGAQQPPPGYESVVSDPVISASIESSLHGVGQIMFQASIFTGILFLIGITLSDREHGGIVLLGSIVGMLVASYHVDSSMRSLDPEQLIQRDQFENIRLGLYGYNAALTGIAIYLWKRSLVIPISGMILSVPLTELIPRIGVPALTAPFVLSTWIVLVSLWIDKRYVSQIKN